MISEHPLVVGATVGVLARSIIAVAIASLLGGCSAVETRSAVSGADLPAGKYHAVAVFVENVNEEDRAIAEEVVVSDLHGAGVRAVSETALFRGTQLDRGAKAKIVQSEFDAVLYLTVVEKGVSEKRLENITHNGQTLFYRTQIPGGTFFDVGVGVGEQISQFWILKEDGSVYEPLFALKAKSDLQDTHTNITVWSAESIATGNPRGTTMRQLLEEVSKQMVSKMRADNTI